MTLSINFRRSASKRLLLLSAGLAWSLAGFFVLSDGIKNLVEYSHHLQFHLMLSFFAGAFLYIIFFKSISDKHANHIYSLKKTFTLHQGINNLRAYFLIFLGIAFLLYLKNKSYFHIVDTSVATIIYGLSLFLSSIRFFYLLVFFRKFYKKYYLTQKYFSH